MKIPSWGPEPVLFYRKGENEVNKFWDLLKSSVIVQGVVTIMFCGTACYLYATGQEIPESLVYFVSGVIGFFFGAKIQQKLGG